MRKYYTSYWWEQGDKFGFGHAIIETDELKQDRIIQLREGLMKDGNNSNVVIISFTEIK